jgi:hypothetical protein
MGFTKRELIQFLDGLVELASKENKTKAVLAKEKFLSDFEKTYGYEKEVITEVTKLPPHYIAAMPDSVQEEIKQKVLVAMHWEHRFNHMVGRYNSIFKVQMPNITPHVCRHTYCTNQAKAGMSPKTLQYLMGHSEIGVTLNTYTHLGLEDAAEELKRMQELEKVRKEMYGEEPEKPMNQNMFKVV